MYDSHASTKAFNRAKPDADSRAGTITSSMKIWHFQKFHWAWSLMTPTIIMTTTSSRIVKALAEVIKEKFSIEAVFVDIPTGL